GTGGGQPTPTGAASTFFTGNVFAPKSEPTAPKPTASAPAPPATPADAQPQPEILVPIDDAVAQDTRTLQGSWRGAHMDYRTEKQGILPAITIKGNTIQRQWHIVRRNNAFRFVASKERNYTWEFTVNPAPSSRSIDLKCLDGENAKTIFPGIYRIENTVEGIKLTLAFDLLGKQRPTSFVNSARSTAVVLIAVK